MLKASDLEELLRAYHGMKGDYEHNPLRSIDDITVVNDEVHYRVTYGESWYPYTDNCTVGHTKLLLWYINQHIGAQ